MSDLDVELRLRVVDEASRQIDNVAKKAQKANENIKNSTKQSEDAQQQAKQKTARVAQDVATKEEMLSKRVAQAKKTLAIGSERNLQHELRQTQQAYQVLAKSGVASARDLAKAKEALIRKTRELRAEEGKMPTGQRLANSGKTAMGLVAGATAGTMMLKEPVRRELGYDRELAMVANTAYSDKDAEGRIKGKQELNETVKNAVAVGGGTREEAIASLNSLLASGMNIETAKNLLPTLQKGGVATGASAEDLAAITISALQNGIAEADIGKALDMAIAAGQAGQFELRDMAKWLPQQMAKAGSMGLKGMEGFQTLLVANQQARVTAGTNDEAGNNLSNLLAKITAKETADRFSKLEYKDKKGKLKSIDFLKSMEGYKSKGKNSLEAFMSIMDDVVGHDDRYIALQKKLKTAKKEDQAKLLKEMANLVEGTAIGQIISDQQGLMALLGIRNNVQLGQDVNNAVTNSAGALDTSHKVIADTNDYKIEQLKSTAEFAQMESLKGFNSVLGGVSEALTEYAAEYPNLTTALVGAATGIGALGAAALAAAGSISLLGGKKGGVLDTVGDLIDTKSAKRLRGFKFGAGGAMAAAVGVGLYAAAEHKTDYDAQQEASKEKRAEAEKKFGEATAIKSAQTFKYGMPATSMPTTNYHGGYIIADRLQNNAVAQARVKNGSLSEEAADARAARNQAIIQGVSQPQKEKAQGNGLIGLAQQMGTLGAQQNAMQGRVGTVEGVLSNYQGDFKAFGQSISTALEAGLASQSHTIANQITVELDGSVVAEKVSEYQFNFNKRMA